VRGPPSPGVVFDAPVDTNAQESGANVSEFDDACALTGVRDAGGAVAQQHAPRAALLRPRHSYDGACGGATGRREKLQVGVKGCAAPEQQPRVGAGGSLNGASSARDGSNM
jgi:hypothetical protein